MDERIAEMAGLICIPPEALGLRRVRRGRGFSIERLGGGVVKGDEREWVDSLAIPPAWTDVRIAHRRDAHILAVGVDDAGRTQYRYHPEWRRVADELKFERMAGFGDALKRVRRTVAVDLRGDLDAQDTQAAIVTRLLDDAMIRVGSRRYAEDHETYGATTLLAEHVDVSGSTIRLSFRAKSGLDREIEIRDRLLARRIGQLVDDLDDEDPIFHDDEGRPISRTTVNRYLERITGGRFTAKDFRTWGANVVVTEHLATAAPDDDRAVLDAVEEAAEHLGNTPAVCRNSYIAPAVLDAHERGELVDAWARSRSSKLLSRAERTCARVLGG